MARKKKQTALYRCVKNCVFDVVNKHGEVNQKFFTAADVLEDPLRPLTQGGPGYEDCMLEVPQGEIVCKHFVPANETAEDDREDQCSNPKPYIENERDIILIAELMAQAGLFKHVMGPSRRNPLKQTVVKTARDVAIDTIKEVYEIDEDDIVEAGKDVARERAIMDMLTWGTDAKSQRSAIGKVLKGADIKYFPGLEPDILAGLVYDEQLYEKK